MKYLTLSILLALPTANVLATNLNPVPTDEMQVPVLNNDIRKVDVNVQSLHSYMESQGGNTQSVVGAPATPSSYPGNGGNSYQPVGYSYTIPYNSVSGATYYKLYESTTDSNYTEVYSGSQLSASFTHYNWGYRYYKYQACNSAGCSGLSPWRRMYIYANPSPPSSLSVSPYGVAEGTSYNVTWGSANGSVDGTVYSLYESFNGGSETLVSSKTRQHWSETSYTHSTTKNADGQYDYRVRACSPNAGCSSFKSASQSVVEPVNTAPVAKNITAWVYTCPWGDYTAGLVGTDAEDNDSDLTVTILDGGHKYKGYAYTRNGWIYFAPSFGCLNFMDRVTIEFYVTDSQGVRSAKNGTVTFDVSYQTPTAADEAEQSKD